MTKSTDSPSTCPRCGAPIAEDAPQGLCPKCVLAGAATVPDSQPRRRTPAPSLESLAPHFPDLEILELIGSGGMGAVYRARQPKLDRIVALKILSHDLGEDPAFAERFLREARVLARLSHPNIVSVHDSGSAGPHAYLLMEYVDGVNLRQAMQAGRFTPSEALALVQDICSALKFAHEEGVLHRDIKPENILIDSRGQVKIADFGIAKLVGQEESENFTLTMEGSLLGSPQYMAPEQIETPGDVDQRADIYSLGVVLYEMLTGELPIGRFALPSEKAAIDARIDEIVLRTLEKEREARFQSAEEVRTEVAAFEKSGPPVREGSSGRWLAMTGAVLQLGPGLGLVGCAVAGLFHAFDVGSSGNTLTATELSRDISGAILPFLIGSVFGLIGTVLLLIALFATEYRARWFFWFMMGYSIISLFAFPVGTVVGVVCLIALTKRKEEFTARTHDDRSGPSNDGGIAQFANRSVFFAALGLLLCLWPYALWKVSPDAGETTIEATLLLAFAVLPPLIPGVLATVLGGRTLRTIRQSGDSRVAVLRSWIGVAALPVVVLTLLATASLTGYRLSTGIPEKGDPAAAAEAGSEANWRKGRPEVTLELAVEPGLVATIEFVRSDENGQEQEVPDYLDKPAGYVIAPDTEPWRGTLEFGSLGGPAISYGPRWLMKIEGSSTDYSHVGAWEAEWEEPITLTVSSPGVHHFQVARGSSEPDLPGFLSLQVSAVERTIPGIPTAVTGRHVQEGWVAATGSAEKLDWMVYVRKELEKLEPELPEGSPEIDLALTVGAGLVGTYELVRIDAVGKEEAFDEHQGFLLVSDEEPWEGLVRFAAEAYDESTGSWKMSSSVRSESKETVVTPPTDERGRTRSFDPEWTWSNEPLELELSESGQHLFEVARRSDLSQTLALRVEARPRRVRGVPAMVFDHVALPVSVRGHGGDIEWIRYLMEETQKTLGESESPLPPREPEPDWREGKPEGHVNLTIEPGVVAQVEFTGPDGSGGEKTYHRGYIVSSDLEPWEGKLRVGSVADSSRIQWRIDGPFHSVTADIEPGWEWQVEPMATNSEITNPGVQPAIKVIAAGSVGSGRNTAVVSFVVTSFERKRLQTDLPEVFAFHFMGLGDDPNWIEDVRRTIEEIDKMNELEAEFPPESK